MRAARGIYRTVVEHRMLAGVGDLVGHDVNGLEL
jgi:hypothetical protein